MSDVFVKTADEAATFTFDFSPELAAGETLTAVSAISQYEDGATSTALTFAGQTLATPHVLVRVSGGTAGRLYDVECKATSSGGQTLVVTGQVAVAPAHNYTAASGTLYCSMADVRNRLSAAGVNLRLDDVPPAADAEVLDQAAAEVDFHCFHAYDPANLVLSRWVRHAAADIATFLLCERRGNGPPKSIARKFEKAMERLEAVLAGRRIPGVPQRADSVPVMSQPRVRLDPVPHTVIERKRGSSKNAPADYPQRTDVTEWDIPRGY